MIAKPADNETAAQFTIRTRITAYLMDAPARLPDVNIIRVEPAPLPGEMDITYWSRLGEDGVMDFITWLAANGLTAKDTFHPDRPAAAMGNPYTTRVWLPEPADLSDAEMRFNEVSIAAHCTKYHLRGIELGRIGDVHIEFDHVDDLGDMLALVRRTFATWGSVAFIVVRREEARIIADGLVRRVEQ